MSLSSPCYQMPSSLHIMCSTIIPASLTKMITYFSILSSDIIFNSRKQLNTSKVGRINNKLIIWCVLLALRRIHAKIEFQWLNRNCIFSIILFADWRRSGCDMSYRQHKLDAPSSFCCECKRHMKHSNELLSIPLISPLTVSCFCLTTALGI